MSVLGRISRQLEKVRGDRLWEHSWVVVAGKGLRAESFQQNLQNKSIGHEETFFLNKHVEQFFVPNFLAVSGNLWGKFPVVDDVLSSHEQKIHPNASIHENCIESEFQTARNYYVDLRQTYLALKLNFVKGRRYETYNTKELKKKHND